MSSRTSEKAAAAPIQLQRRPPADSALRTKVMIEHAFGEWKQGLVVGNVVQDR